jgi:hypothetical protein
MVIERCVFEDMNGNGRSNSMKPVREPDIMLTYNVS